MNEALVDAIVKAVLYEGYMLYPYRPSAIKNRQRFNFGVVYPRAYSEVQRGVDAWTMQTECLVQGDEKTQCLVRVRFLRMVDRSIGKVQTPVSETASLSSQKIENADRLEISGKVYQPWQEAVEEEIQATEFNLSTLSARPVQWPFRMPATQDTETIRDEGGLIAGTIERRKSGVAGTIVFASECLETGLFKLTARLENTSTFDGTVVINREEALARSLVSAHTILEVQSGEFVSLVDPPESLRQAAQTCRNAGTWPVLVGEEGQRRTLLSSPIILYDYPRVAPESPGDLFDGAEIDEILMLRILTLTDEEKLEMRQSDDRARQILERTESLPEEQFMKLHGVLRGLRGPKEETP
jgi:hypothetical protein